MYTPSTSTIVPETPSPSQQTVYATLEYPKPDLIKLNISRSQAEIRRNGRYKFYGRVTFYSARRLARMADHMTLFQGWFLVPEYYGWMCIGLHPRKRVEHV